MKFLLLFVALTVHLTTARAAPSCMDAFETKRASQRVIENRESLIYESAMEVIEQSLEIKELAQWREMVERNGDKVAKKLKQKFEIIQPRSEAEIFEQVSKLISRHVEASLKRSKLAPLYSVYLTGPLKNPQLTQALKENYFYLAELSKQFPEAKLTPNRAASGLFTRILLSTLMDTQISTFRSLSRNDELLKLAPTPDLLQKEIGRKIRLETGLRWTYQHFINLKLSIFAAAGLTLAVEHHAGQSRIQDVMRTDPRGQILNSPLPEVAVLLGQKPTADARQILKELAARPARTQAEQDFFAEITKEIGSNSPGDSSSPDLVSPP